MTQPASAPTAQASFIAVEKLSKHFGSKHALEAVDLQLAKGETMAIIGPSAAGKSVLMKCLVGIYLQATKFVVRCHSMIK